MKEENKTGRWGVAFLHLSGDYVIDINPCEKRMGEDITWLSCPFLAGCEMSCWIHPFLSWVIGSCRTRDCPRASSMLSQCSITMVYPLSYFYPILILQNLAELPRLAMKLTPFYTSWALGITARAARPGPDQLWAIIATYFLSTVGGSRHLGTALYHWDTSHLQSCAFYTPVIFPRRHGTGGSSDCVPSTLTHPDSLMVFAFEIQSLI